MRWTLVIALLFMATGVGKTQTKVDDFTFGTK